MSERVGTSDGMGNKRLTVSAAMALASQMAALDVQDLPLTPDFDGPSPQEHQQLFSPDTTGQEPSKRSSFLKVCTCPLPRIEPHSERRTGSLSICLRRDRGRVAKAGAVTAGRGEWRDALGAWRWYVSFRESAVDSAQLSSHD